MMRRHVAVVGVLVGALLVPVGAGAFASTSNDDSTSSVGIPERSAAAEAAFRDVTRCLNSGQNPSLDVLYLVDLSDSVKREGLADVQRDVLTASVEQLNRFVQQDIEVRYGLVGFANGAKELISWTQVDGTSQAERLSRALVEHDLDKRPYLTDWERGLTVARDTFDQRESSCRMLVWMTDGALIPPGGGVEDSLAALERICRPGIRLDGADVFDGPYTGLVHQLKERGIPIFGVFFTQPGLVDGLDEFQQWKISFMRPIVEGAGVIEAPRAQEVNLGLRGFPIECTDMNGEVASEGLANGAFIESEDPVALAFDFLRLEAGILGGSGVSADANGRFRVPPGTAYFRVIVPSEDLTLTNPNGEVVPVVQGAITEAGGATSIEVEVDESGWGEWTVASEGDAIVYLFTGLALELNRDLNDSILSGADNTLSGKVVSEEGRNILVDSVLTANFENWGTVEVVVVSGNLDSQPVGSLSSTGVFEVTGIEPSDSSPIELRVSLALGGVFDPIESTFRLTVIDGDAIAYPLDKSLELGDLVGPDGAASGVLRIIAPVDAESAQVCLAQKPDPLYEVPTARNQSREVDDFTWEVDSGAPVSDDGCFIILRNEPVELSINVGHPDQLDSRVDGVFTVESRTADGTPVHTEPVLIGFDSRTEQNPWIVVAAIILMLILGLGLPLAALWLWNRAATRFAPVDAVTRVAYPVRIERTGRMAVLDRRRDSDGQRITVRPNDFGYVASQSKSAEFDSGRGQMRARVPWFPLATSWFEWVAPPGHRVVSVVAGSTKQTREIESFLATEVSADVARAWAIIVSDSALLSEDAAIDGELVVFSGMHSDVRQYQRRVDDVIATPGLMDALTAAAQSARADRQAGSMGESLVEPVSVGVTAPSSMPDVTGRSIHQPGAPTPPGAPSFDPSQSGPTFGSSAPAVPGPLSPPRPPSGPLAPPPPPQ